MSDYLGNRPARIEQVQTKQGRVSELEEQLCHLMKLISDLHDCTPNYGTRACNNLDRRVIRADRRVSELVPSYKRLYSDE